MIFLVRHGNTFESGQTPYFIGSKEDLPLTAAGREQIRRVGEYLLASGKDFGEILTGPLSRARESGEILSQILSRSSSVDSRLDELDYGIWGGLSDSEVKLRFGVEAIESWVNRGELQPGFQPSESEILTRVNSLLGSPPGTVLVSSNGFLRFFSPSRERVRTGALCEIEGEQILQWDLRP